MNEILDLIEMAKNATDEQIRIEMKNCISHFQDTVSYYRCLDEATFDNDVNLKEDMEADRSGLWWHILNAELQSRLKK